MKNQKQQIVEEQNKDSSQFKILEKRQDTQNLITQVCTEIATFLINKNIAYGDSAINPIRIFSKANSIEQINVRIDDKINRFLQGNGYPGDDDELDLIGYLILKQVAKLKNKEK